jgi:hypothetical protein
MTTDLRRTRAVAASLRGIRQRVLDHAEIVEWDTLAFDNAIGLLGDAIEDADFSGHALEQTEISSEDYLVHLESLIAFLEVYEEDGAGGSVVNFHPRQQG